MSEAAKEEPNQGEAASRELVFGEIRRLGLEANLIELEENGYTVVELSLIHISEPTRPY